ncbi:unnamed protein product [Penicillium salamii]|uniref:Dyp-type peroxidase n=1 Tax=Penicillium salamii TaxID=1612424 RepID=A0A9W4NFZ1_9EURO|nr:unnamed protein product [Penicillium salamii]CAG8343210.1 unnamed protein product [Penicillium salamii]CAG8364884.1 unnamed protein product [Penicillium salamii]CAG8374522.1 unnamed protein product [Penicillium salamii]CAG8409752.1 unnamed protein product [Penicillium salamii]
MVDQKNVQGDIWPRLPKKAEKFVFFRITNVEEFKKGLPMMADFITTAHAASQNRDNIFKKKAEGTLKGLISLVSINIAFSSIGLAKLKAEKLNDDVFNGGQFKDMTAPSAGETEEDHQGLDAQHEWLPQFKPSGGGIDGVLVVAGDSLESIDKTTKKTYEWVFNIGNDKQSVEEVYTKVGVVYPDHLEHFGWVDGISQPVVKGFDDIEKKSDAKGMTPIDPGIIIVGGEGDESNHPDWAKDGSFMVFRIYEQLVPEFYHWCAFNTPLAVKEIIEAQKAQKEISWSSDAYNEMGLFSSRLIGRWPDGAPVELYPSTDPMDGLKKSKDKEENMKIVEANLQQEGLDRLKKMQTENHTDAFNYTAMDQTKCPYASHMRKTGPRDDCPNYTKHLIMRRGIPYGEWCEDEERAGGVTKQERGLLFVCYQSSIDNGFCTQQKRWANTEDGPTDMSKHNGGNSQGIDPIIGQVHPSHLEECPADGGRAKYKNPPKLHFPETVYGKEAPQVYDKTVDLARLCIPHGGEYFFTPSIKALKDYIPNI